jgi:tetratricopeptide (TPR) repeat protein
LISPRSAAFARLACLVALVVLALPRGLARADSIDRLPNLATLRGQAMSARGPFVYGALRKVWSEWEAGDPVAVEEVIYDVASSPEVSPPARVYASLLEAYARRRRGDLDGAHSRIARLGFVSDWMLLGPFDNEGKAGFLATLDPERDDGAPLNLARDYDGKDHRPVRWRLLPPASPYGWVDFGVFVRPAEQVCVIAQTFVRDARVTGHTSRPVSLWVGSAGAFRVSWNGTEVLRDDKYRDLDPDRLSARTALAEGWNRLSAKVCGDERAPMLSLRVAGADGAPDEHIEVSADPRHSTHEGGAAQVKPPVIAAAPKGAAAAAPPPPSSGEGPIQAFERLSAHGDPAVLEAYARYLGATGSDDPTEHRARELARRAAEAAPTIPRLLLAGEVAENRNQRATWIAKAEDLLARTKQPRPEDVIAVLLARAGYIRGGVNWRDAAQPYERVLELDPDNVPATLAKVDLYEEAGLRETALAILERALARRPRSVGLLRAAVAALRDEGRDAEADAMADRYAAFRFDDPAFARARIDLAVARRDTSTAARWIDRLTAANPDSIGALETAAEAWTKLGDRARAIGAYRAALDLAPADTEVMRRLATTYSLGGARDEQLRLLKRVLELTPQAKEVRDEVAHIEPAAPRPDEQYAHPSAEFLARRGAPAEGQDRRTLVDLQVTTVFPNGLASRFHQVVYQPLNDAAAAGAREYAFTYETDSETVQVRTARVYRQNGQVDEAVESGAGAMADDPALAIFTSARSYYIHFPRLEPGDVVEVQYRVEDVAPRNVFADYFGEIVYMQSSEPIGRSEYVLKTPKERAFYFNEPHVPGLKQTLEERGGERIYHFVANDVPPVRQEPLQPPWTEVLGHVNVSTYKTWEDVGRWYWGLVKDQFVPDDEVRRRAETLTKGLKDDAAKVRAVYDYVVQKTRYVALEFGIHGYKPYRCAQIFARGFGDCKDKATLIVTMLQSLGIKATPVVVRTGNKGDIEASPASLAPFDHMIAYVPSLDLYLDGTAEDTGTTELPAMDRGAVALQVNEGHSVLVHLPDPPETASLDSSKLDVALNPDGSAAIDWRVEITGVEASGWRARFHAQATRKQRVQQLVAATLPGVEIMMVEAGDLQDVEQKVSLHVKGKVPRFARAEGDATSVPLGRREHMVRDYAARAERALDVRTYAQWTQTDDWTVRIPAGAKVRAAPTSAHGSGPFGSYSAEVTVSPASIRVKTSVTLTKTRIATSEYAAFRAWCEEVDRALGQRAMVAFK